MADSSSSDPIHIRNGGKSTETRSRTRQHLAAHPVPPPPAKLGDSQTEKSRCFPLLASCSPPLSSSSSGCWRRLRSQPPAQSSPTSLPPPRPPPLRGGSPHRTRGVSSGPIQFRPNPPSLILPLRFGAVASSLATAVLLEVAACDVLVGWEVGTWELQLIR